MKSAAFATLIKNGRKNARCGAGNTRAAIWKSLNMADHPLKELDYSYITDGIYIGTNQCCEVHFAEKLLKVGITADISLEEERIDSPFGVLFYLWLPVKDHTAPSEDQLDFGVNSLKEFVRLERKIYVHCKNGHGRANTLVAAYLISKGLSPEEAEVFVKKQRPVTHLQDVQKKALRDFYKKWS